MPAVIVALAILGVVAIVDKAQETKAKRAQLEAEASSLPYESTHYASRNNGNYANTDETTVDTPHQGSARPRKPRLSKALLTSTINSVFHRKNKEKRWDESSSTGPHLMAGM
jgi:hypothetical protein